LPPANPTILPRQGRPTVILVVGVNGTGKTTSSAEIGALSQVEGKFSAPGRGRHLSRGGD